MLRLLGQELPAMLLGLDRAAAVEVDPRPQLVVSRQLRGDPVELLGRRRGLLDPVEIGEQEIRHLAHRTPLFGIETGRVAQRLEGAFRLAEGAERDPPHALRPLEHRRGRDRPVGGGERLLGIAPLEEHPAQQAHRPDVLGLGRQHPFQEPGRVVGEAHLEQRLGLLDLLPAHRFKPS